MRVSKSLVAATIAAVLTFSGAASAKGRGVEGAKADVAASKGKPKSSASKADAPKGEASKGESSKTESSKTESSKGETSKSETSKAKTAPPSKPASTGDGPLTREEVKKRIKGTPYLEVRARDLSLTERSLDRLMRISKRYFEATHKHLTVTGGTRNAQRQAELMCSKIEHGEDVVALYENKRAAREVLEAFQASMAVKGSRGQAVKAVRQKIEEQVAHGEFISRHLLSGAADIRSRGMSATQQASFRKAVMEEPGTSILDERDGAAPHFHLNL